MYAELLDASPSGTVGVGERHMRLRRTIIPRNVRELSKEVGVPRCGVVNRPHRLASTRESSQKYDILQTERHLADGKLKVYVSGRHRSINAAIKGVS
jgi:hypothetical protein